MNSTSVLSTMKSFYVTISRAKESAEIYTDDVGDLRNVISRATGERVSALDAIGFRDAVRNLNDVHVEAVNARKNGPEDSNVYFLKFGDEKPAPDLRASRDDQEPTLPGLDRPKADDQELKSDRTPDQEGVRKDDRDHAKNEDDEPRERIKAPQEDRIEQEIRDSQQQPRTPPQERDQGFER